MDPSKVDWLPPLAVLGAGIVLGAAFLRRLSRPAVPGTRVEAGAGSEPAAGDSADPGLPCTGRRRSILWDTGALAVAGGLLFSIAHAARPRAEGEALTGASTGRMTLASSSTDGAEGLVKAALARDPDDMEARLELARLSLDKQDYMAVWAETQKVLARSPEEPRALTYQSQIWLALGQPEVALEMLDQAVAMAPDILAAHAYRIDLRLRVGKTEEARAALAEAKRRFPAEAAQFDERFAEARAEVEKTGPMPLGGQDNPHAGLRAGGAANPHAGMSPHRAPNPHATATQAAVNPHQDAASPAVEGQEISGTLDLDPALKGKVAANAVVFLTVREAGFGAGPPIAAKRLAAAFPLHFEIGPGDSMQGARIPAKSLVEARIDTDGDPMTKDPTDLAARVDDVAAGSPAVHLVLKRR
jgi:tetratricopeptide (TPR) repeat protein